MLNLHDLSTGSSTNFYDVSAVRIHDQSDDSDSVHHLHSRLCFDSVSTRSVTHPWEFDFASLKSSDLRRYHGDQRSGFSFSDGMTSEPFSVSNHTSFAILGDVLAQQTDQIDAQPRHSRFSYTLVATFILLCIAFHTIGLVVFFTPWYNHTIQVAIFRHFYTSFSDSGFEESIDAKRNAVAVVYLLVVGMVPTLIAATLWFTFSSELQFRRTIQIPRFLRRKPVFLSKWKPLYIDATWDEILFLILLVVANSAIFLSNMLRSRSMHTASDEEIWRDIGMAFASNALFNLVWLLLFLSNPSPWAVYIDFFTISDESDAIKYRNWFGLLIVSSSTLHVICMIIHLQLTGERSSRLFPSSHMIATDPLAGMTVFGEIAFGIMLLLGIGVALGGRIPHNVTLWISPVARLLFLLTLCVHYPVTLAWIQPTLVLFLIQKSVTWTHSRYPVELVDMAPLPNGITRIVLRRTIDKMDLSGSNFVAGQRVYVRLPQVSWVQWQRCTITTSSVRNPGVFTVYIYPPNTSNDVNSTEAVLAREIHDIAKVAYAAQKPPIVYVDGFYGPTHPIFYEQYKCLAFIVGGIGVVEMLSLLEQLYHEAWLAACSALDSKIAREVGDDIEDPRALPAKRFNKQVWVLWTCEDVCLFKEFEDLFFRIKLLDPNEVHFKLRLCLTKIPLTHDIEYQRLQSAGFICQGVDLTDVKNAAIGRIADNTNPCRRPHSHKPQNRSSLSCWSSRPFQQAASGAFCRTLILILATSAVVPVGILVIWYALKTKALEVFPVFQLLRNIGLLLLTCVIFTGVIAFINDCLLGCQRKHHEKFFVDRIRHIHRSGVTTPTIGLKKLRSVTRMCDGFDSSGELERDIDPRPSEPESVAVGPDIMEKLMIYTMQPDIDKFLRTVGRSFPAFAGTIGVFASGNEALIGLVEASTLACEASAGEWCEVAAGLEFHQLG